MARAVISAPKKKKPVRAARRLSGFALMSTTDWNKAKWFVHYEIESREWLSTIQRYIAKHMAKPDAAAIAVLPDWKVGGGSHWATTAYWLLNDLSPPIGYVRSFNEFLQKLVVEGKALVIEKKLQEKNKKNVHVPNIQERIYEQSKDAAADIEEWLDTFITDPRNFDPTGFDITSHFLKFEVTQAHARRIAKFFEGQLSEARKMANKPTAAQIAKLKTDKERDLEEQFLEGYKHVSKKQAQAYLQALEAVVSACTMVVDTSKAARKPRVKKAPSKEKLIAGLKYKLSDDRFKVVSVNPSEIVSCEEVWVFNSKTRKLGKYVADETAGVISVKGSTLIGFDEAKSVQKTLRKPEETLKDFKESGKVRLRKFMEDIKTTEIKLNGRINEDTIILKISTTK